jgi:uncharacterized protein YvpB
MSRVPSVSGARRGADGRPAQRRPAAASATRRRWGATFLVIAVLAAAAGVAVGGRDAVPLRVSMPGPAARRALMITVDGVPRARIPVSAYLRAGVVDQHALVRALAARLPALATIRRNRATITYRYDIEATAQRARPTAGHGGQVAAVRRAVTARVTTPVLAQAQRNTCESAALEILLATRGRRISQQRLQRAFPRSGPVDPRGPTGGQTWGDPDRGFVGRPDGGGPAGGFGIYPGPVRDTARRLGVPLDDLSGASARSVYRRLLAGRAVMAWVGLSNGPFGTWTSPQGRTVTVNFGEHTVVLYGARADGALLVSNPLQGTREVWSRSRFESMWQLLGRRALTW